MTTATTEFNRQQVLETLKDLPEKNALPEALERLYILYKLQQGIEAADAGRVISHEDAKAQFRSWLR